MGFWHGFRNGESTWNDRIIKALLDAKTAGKPNPYPERMLKNVNVFESFDNSSSLDMPLGMPGPGNFIESKL